MPVRIEGVDEFSEEIFQPKKGESTYNGTLHTTAQNFANRSIWCKSRIEELTEILDESLSNIYYMKGVPDDSFGVDGELYIDSSSGTSTNKNIYYKKTTWKLVVDVDNQGNIDTLNNVDPVNRNIDITVGNGLEIDNSIDGKIAITLYVTPVASISGGSTNEIGATISNINLSWTYNKTEISQSLNQGLGVQINGVRTAIDTSSITTNTTYTLTIDDGTTEITSSTSVSFKNKSHWGTSPMSSLTSSQILTLANDAFSTNKNLNFSIDGLGEYIYNAYPSSYGLATFKVNGLLNTAWTLTVVSHTNSSGYIENYNVYRTNTIQNGTGIQVEIS